MKRPLLTLFLVCTPLRLLCCDSISPVRRRCTSSQGLRWRCDNVEGVEIWVKGAPSKPFTVRRVHDGQYTEDIGEEAALKRLIVKKVKEVSGSGVIRTSCSSGRGDSYFVGNVLITDTDIKDEYVVFRYQ